VTVLARRRFLITAGAACVGVAEAMGGAVAAPLPATPRQSAGPFYPRPLPLETDADLVRMAGAADPAIGTVTHVSGRVLDRSGAPIVDSLVEIWQCDALGRYRHPRDPGPRDEGFQGYGRVRTNGDGAYRFRTIRPVPYPGRTPHIHFAVTVPGGTPWTTQMYVAGEPLNERDFLLAQVRDPAARARLLVDLEPAPDIEPAALAGRFDIVLAP
jgi:protocatechuate 3,4-dioxygenase, beta subunit